MRPIDLLNMVAKGVEKYDISLETQLVNVTGTIPYDDLLAKIKKTGKEVCGHAASFGVIELLNLSQVRSGKIVE